MSILNTGHILVHREATGAVELFTASSDSDTVRGSVFKAAHDTMVAGDTMYLGPGTFEVDPDDWEDGFIVGVAGTTLWGSGDLTVLTCSSAAGTWRYHPRTGQTFRDLKWAGGGADGGGSFILLTGSDDGSTDVSDITLINVTIVAGEDLIYTDDSYAGSGTNWRMYGCRLSTVNHSGSNDLIFLAGSGTIQLKCFNCDFDSIGEGVSSFLDAIAVEAGGANVIELFNCRIRVKPRAQPGVWAAGVQAHGSGIVRLLNSYIEVVTGGFTSVYSASAFNGGIVQVANSVLDTSKLHTLTGGTIVNIQTTVP